MSVAGAVSASLAAALSLCCLTQPAVALSKGHRVTGWALDLEDTKTSLVQQLTAYACYGDFVKPGDRSLVAVISAHPSENCDVTWLADQPHEAVIISDISKDGKNRYTGFEGGAYLNFILNNYEKLPDKIAFMHGHRKAWEINDEANILKNLDVNSYPYAGLSKKWAVDLRQDDINLTRSFLQTTVGEAEAAKLPSERFNFSFPSGGSFMVSKDRILRRSKDTWYNIYNWLQTSAGKQHARALEFSWHVLMGEPAQMNPPNPAVLCPKNPEACMHQPFVDASFPRWRLDWYNSHDVGGEKVDNDMLQNSENVPADDFS